MSTSPLGGTTAYAKLMRRLITWNSVTGARQTAIISRGFNSQSAPAREMSELARTDENGTPLFEVGKSIVGESNHVAR